MNFITFTLALLSILSLSFAGQTCSDGSPPSIIKGQTICCPGTIQVNNDDVSCCVGGSPGGGSIIDPCFMADESSTCTSSATSTPDTCKTVVPITASGYTSIVYAALSGVTSMGGMTMTGPPGSDITPRTTIDLGTATGNVGAMVTQAPVLALAAAVGMAML